MSSPCNPGVDEAPILHLDLDAFFATVEVLDDPSLAGKPVAVGGAGERGAIASASYEARRYGVKSAMPSVQAKRLCPNLIILPGRFDRYEDYSKRFHNIVNDVTPDYEPLGLDEIFADLRSLRRINNDPVAIAINLRDRLYNELGLRSGVGLGRNKLFAKLASKRSKPSVKNGKLVAGPGLVFVDPVMEHEWLEVLPVRSLWGVGPATSAKLERLGLTYVRDLRKVDVATLATHVGQAMAAVLIDYAKGEDTRVVEPYRKAKSIGSDQTYAKSLHGLAEVSEQLKVRAGVVARGLRANERTARTITLNVRYDDMTGVSRSQTLPFGIDDEVAIHAIASSLAETVSFEQAVRLVGIHASSFVDREVNNVQLSFDVMAQSVDSRAKAEEQSRQRQIEHETLRDAIDGIRKRFGEDAVATVGELKTDGIIIEDRHGRSSFGAERDQA